MKAIIVGSAATLLNKKRGSIIDTYDYVIRPITSLVATGYEEYTGSKTDMYWITFQYLSRLTLLKKPTDILCAFASDDNYSEFYINTKTAPIRTMENRYYYDYIISLCNKNIKNIYYMPLNTQPELNVKMKYKHPHTTYAENKLRVSATTGMATIFHTLKNPVFSSVAVTGFDAYTTGFYWNPVPSDISKRPFPYREYIYYKTLLKEKKIYEL
jgi:hypothetical protein